MVGHHLPCCIPQRQTSQLPLRKPSLNTRNFPRPSSHGRADTNRPLAQRILHNRSDKPPLSAARAIPHLAPQQQRVEPADPDARARRRPLQPQPDHPAALSARLPPASELQCCRADKQFVREGRRGTGRQAEGVGEQYRPRTGPG